MARSGHVYIAVLLFSGLHFHALGIIIREPVECVDECPQGCFFGNTHNARGCLRCICNNPILCKPVFCGKLSCPFGFKKNELGCNTCACNPNPRICPESKCGQFRCINPETFIDENGCVICSCVDPWLQIQR